MDIIKKLVDKEFKDLEESWVGKILDKTEDLEYENKLIREELRRFEKEIRKEITQVVILLSKMAELTEIKYKK